MSNSSRSTWDWFIPINWWILWRLNMHFHCDIWPEFQYSKLEYFQKCSIYYLCKYEILSHPRLVVSCVEQYEDDSRTTNHTQRNKARPAHSPQFHPVEFYSLNRSDQATKWQRTYNNFLYNLAKLIGSFLSPSGNIIDFIYYSNCHLFSPLARIKL